MRIRLMIPCALLAVAVACAAPATSRHQEATSTATPVVAPAEAQRPAPGKLARALGEAAIIYQRSGGLAGRSEQWSIYPDGRVATADGREWQVAPDTVEQLLADIEALGFFEMGGLYVPANTCCDRYTYTITVARGNKVNTVTTIDAAPEAPARLWEVLGAVRRFVQNAQQED